MSVSSKKKVKYLFDTTVYYHLFEYSEDFQQFLDDKFINNGRTYTLNLVLLELRIGLIKTFIEYYQMVERLRDAKKAHTIFRRRSGNFNRDYQKVTILTENILPSVDTVINNGDINKYLAQLEAAISNTAIKIRKLTGNVRGEFADHQLLKFDLLEASEYPDYIKVCEDMKFKLPFNEFFASYPRELSELHDKLQNADRAELSTKVLEYIDTLCEKLETVVNEPSNALKKGTYSKMGDIAIMLNLWCLGMGKVTTISNDKSYRTVSKLLTKPHYDYSLELSKIVEEWEHKD